MTNNTKAANPADKYKPFAPIALPNRQWPDQTITRADGNEKS